MGGLAEALINHRPRESAGSSSSNRFEFQRTWAICHLLGLHASTRQYLLILEFHDDLLVLEGETDPKEVEFFQVKTRAEGHWSKTDLLRAEKPPTKKRAKGAKAGSPPPPIPRPAPPRSILGKLLEHSRFGPHVKSLNVVSNVTFKVPLAKDPVSTAREEFCLSELVPDALNEVKAAIAAELGTKEELPWERVFLKATGISITDHERYAIGQLTTFLDVRRPGAQIAVLPLYRALRGELTLRSNCEWQSTSFSELRQKKGIGRADLEAHLRLAEEQLKPGDALRAVAAQLRQEDLPYRDVNDLEASWRRYEMQATNQADMVVQTIKKQVAEVVTEVQLGDGWSTLVSFLNLAQVAFEGRHGALRPPYNASFLQGAILYELKALEARQLSQAHSQHQAGTP